MQFIKELSRKIISSAIGASVLKHRLLGINTFTPILCFMSLLPCFAGKRIIVLEATNSPGGDQNINYCFWFAVPTGNQTPVAGFISRYRGASEVEMSALQSGSVVEQCGSFQEPVAFTTAQIQGDLQSRWTAANVAFQAQPNPNQFYGASWDGITWTVPAVSPGALAKYIVGANRGAGATAINIITGVAGQTTQIYRLVLTCSAVGTIQLKSGATNLGPAVDCSTAAFHMNEAPSGAPIFQLVAGNSFSFSTTPITMTASVIAWYQQF